MRLLNKLIEEYYEDIEQTLSIIKPDAVERGLENDIQQIFKDNGLKLLRKKIQIEKSEAETFYKVHETKPFYNDLCSYLSSGPIIVMVLEKNNAVVDNRKLMGATNPKEAEDGTIRKNMEFRLIKILFMALIVMKMQKLKLIFFLKIRRYFN